MAHGAGDRRSDDTAGVVRLRPVTSGDIAWMATMAADRDAVGEHNWPGQAPDSGRFEADLRAMLERGAVVDGSSGRLVVELGGAGRTDEGTPIGDVAWRTERWGPTPQKIGRAHV